MPDRGGIRTAQGDRFLVPEEPKNSTETIEGVLVGLKEGLLGRPLIRAMGQAGLTKSGDRIMAVFIGDQQTTNAAKCALQLNWCAPQKLAA
jgi:hypothetical protein